MGSPGGAGGGAGDVGGRPLGSLDNCCIIGYHGASVVNGRGHGPTGGNGNQGVQTFSYAAYTTPGTFGDGNGGPDPFLRDIHALSHEIAEWGDDPFVNKLVNPWLTPTAPQYGCTSVLETDDPVVGIGFTMPGNTYDTASPFSDGYFHPEEEVFLPWFARQDPNTTSQTTQSGGGGRYTFMGDLNPYPGFRCRRRAADGCTTGRRARLMADPAPVHSGPGPEAGCCSSVPV